MKINTWLIALSAVAATACSKPRTPVYAGYQNLRLQKAGLAETVIATEIKLYNPNAYPLQVKDADLDLYVNDRRVGKTQLQALINLAAKDTTYVPMQVKAETGDLLRGAAPILLNPNVKMRIEGKVKAGRNGVFVNVPVNFEGTQRINLLQDSANARSGN